MIVVSNLTKQFGQLCAVADLSFMVEPGQAVAFWGANGAGKSTIIHCLLNLMPFSGEIMVNGLDVRREGKKRVRQQIGFVPQELNFHHDLTVVETIQFYAQLKKVPAGHDFRPLLEQLDLAAHVSKRIGTLSGGMKQRLALALALIADPPILLLDEPTANLDIRSRDAFVQLLQGFKQAGKTILFSSHRLDEVTPLADRILLLEGGRLMVDAPTSELEAQLGWQTTLYLSLESAAIPQTMALLTDQGIAAHQNGRGLRVQVAPGKKGQLFRMLYEAGVHVKDFMVD